MEERRQFARLDTRLPITYRVAASSGDSPATNPAPYKEAVSKDVSSGGICLFLEAPLEPGTRLDVHIALPGQASPVSFAGEIAWCEQYQFLGKTEEPACVQAGVKFLQISPQDRARMMQYVILKTQNR